MSDQYQTRWTDETPVCTKCKSCRYITNWPWCNNQNNAEINNNYPIYGGNKTNSVLCEEVNSNGECTYFEANPPVPPKLTPKEKKIWRKIFSKLGINK